MEDIVTSNKDSRPNSKYKERNEPADAFSDDSKYYNKCQLI